MLGQENEALHSKNLQNENTSQDASLDHRQLAEGRKHDHIALAIKSQVHKEELDKRFMYEPLLSAHPQLQLQEKVSFLGKELGAPIWISSMTGGTKWAKTINHNLAKAAKEFGFGMGLGSCRYLLTDDTYLQDFQVRYLIGYDLPFYANLGIAQIEELLHNKQLFLMDEMLKKLETDGLIVHLNPMQEWLQPEGDRFYEIPLVTLKRLIDQRPDLNIIVKEVGQGMGYESLKALVELPIQALDFAAGGGTNFALLELLRNKEAQFEAYEPFAKVGHSAEEMVDMVNQILEEPGIKIACKEVIISGGVRNFLDGYYLLKKIKTKAIYGQASGFLKYARESYEDLYEYCLLQVNGLKMAEAYLKLK